MPRPADHLGTSSIRHAAREDVVAMLALTVLVAVAFAPMLANALVWDDLPNLARNTAYRALTGTSLHWMFTTGFGGHYQPLSWLSLALDHAVWGADDVFGFHLTNLCLHTLNALLVYLLAKLLIRRACGDATSRRLTVAALAAALAFAVHPLRVESVAWATERRDVLSLCFLLLSGIAYVRSTATTRANGRIPLLALAWCAYVCSLLSKATGMTLPVVLLLLDAYPLRRIGPRGTDSWRTVLLEKLAFAVPAVVVAIVAVWAQSQAGALWTFELHPLSLRIGQAFYGLMFYPLKTLWPVHLIPLYEQQPDATPWDVGNILGLVFVVAVSVATWRARRKHPELPVAWFAYVILVAPMLGMAQSGQQVVAERYSYVACLPFALLIGAAVAWCWRTPDGQFSRNKLATVLVACPLCLAMVVATRAQTRIWKNPMTLWTTTLERAPDTPTAHANLAVLYLNEGRFQLAHDHSLATLKRLPGNRAALETLARASLLMGDWVSAEHGARGLIRIASHYGTTDTFAVDALATALSKQERYDEAEAVFQQQIALEPTNAAWRVKLAALYAQRGLLEPARAELNRALEIDPTYGPAYLRSAALEKQRGDAPAAVATLESGLAAKPDDVELMTRLAWLLATLPDDALRDGARAQALAKCAVEYSQGNYPKAVEALAAAQAELGLFKQALATISPLRDHPPDGYGEVDRSQLDNAAAAYAAGRPLRD